ncbi:MAG: hypothetical protein AAFY41_00730 [Bacteroidota bacterium]
MEDTLIDFFIENVSMPSSKEQLVSLLKEAKNQGIDDGYWQGVKDARAGRFHDLHNQEQMQEGLRHKQVLIEEKIKQKLRSIQGVYRLPEEWDVVYQKLKIEQK